MPQTRTRILKKKKHKQNFQVWRRQAANLAISVQVRLPYGLLSYPTGQPRNILCQDLRTETETFSKAVCHSVFYHTSTDVCYEGKNKSTCQLQAASTPHFNEKAFPTDEVISTTAQCSQEAFSGFGLTASHVLADSCVRTSFAANKFPLVNTGILLHFRGLGSLAPKPFVMWGIELFKSTK